MSFDPDKRAQQSSESADRAVEQLISETEADVGRLLPSVIKAAIRVGFAGGVQFATIEARNVLHEIVTDEDDFKFDPNVEVYRNARS